MTVALLAQWGEQPAGTLYESDATTEAAMIAAKVATANLAGAIVWVPNVGTPAPPSGSGQGVRDWTMFLMQSSFVADVTRNSANDATDSNEVTMGTLTIPPGTLRAGSMFEVIALWENTGGASTKEVTLRLNASALGSLTATAALSTAVRHNMHIQDWTTVVALNYVGVNGTGQAAAAIYQKVVPDLRTNPLTVTLTSKWSAAASGEFIRLKHAKLLITT